MQTGLQGNKQKQTPNELNDLKIYIIAWVREKKNTQQSFFLGVSTGEVWESPGKEKTFQFKQNNKNVQPTE